jgi:hypothetical protein
MSTELHSTVSWGRFLGSALAPVGALFVILLGTSVAASIEESSGGDTVDWGFDVLIFALPLVGLSIIVMLIGSLIAIASRRVALWTSVGFNAVAGLAWVLLGLMSLPSASDLAYAVMSGRYLLAGLLLLSTFLLVRTKKAAPNPASAI